jgi:hypothetical protein
MLCARHWIINLDILLHKELISGAVSSGAAKAYISGRYTIWVDMWEDIYSCCWLPIYYFFLFVTLLQKISQLFY